MTSPVDEVIRSVGLACTIVRTSGNVSTYFYINPGKSWKDAAPYARDGMMPTDSGVVSGDLIQYGSEYYLVVAILDDRRAGEFFFHKIRLFKCNNTITIKSYDAATKAFIDSKTGVPCLIVDGRASVMSDRGIMVPGYTGKDLSYYLYAQDGAGISKNSIMVDLAGRHLRALDSINYYFAGGLVEVGVKLEA